MPAHSKQSKVRNHGTKSHVVEKQSPTSIQMIPAQAAQNLPKIGAGGQQQPSVTRNVNAPVLNNSSHSGDGDDEYENDFEQHHPAPRGQSKGKHYPTKIVSL